MSLSIRFVLYELFSNNCCVEGKVSFLTRFRLLMDIITIDVIMYCIAERYNDGGLLNFTK